MSLSNSGHRSVRIREKDVVSTNSCQTSKKKNGKFLINQYRVLKTIGSGSFARVKLVKDTVTNELFAMKTMNKQFLKS